MAGETVLVRPGAGQTVTIRVSPAARLAFPFNQADANLDKDGQNLIFTFNNGGKLILAGFYDHFDDNGKPPTLIVESNEISGVDFLAAYDNPDLMPASGPAAPVIMLGGGSLEDLLLLGEPGVSGMDKFSFDGFASGGGMVLRGVDGVESLGVTGLGAPSSGDAKECGGPDFPGGSGGGGDDGVSAIGMQSSTIDTGADNDSISISVPSGCSAMYKSFIDTGTGNDTVTITGDVKDSTINLGDGNDFLMFKGNVSGMNLDGGGERIQFEDVFGDGYIARLGDILGLGGAAINSLPDIFTAGHNTIVNFESLLLDYTDSGTDALTLDNLLVNFVDKMAAGGANDVQSLIIKGVDADHITIASGDLLTAHAAKGETVTIEGVKGDFVHYTLDASTEHEGLHLYIQLA